MTPDNLPSFFSNVLLFYFNFNMALERKEGRRHLSRSMPKKLSFIGDKVRAQFKQYLNKKNKAKILDKVLLKPFVFHTKSIGWINSICLRVILGDY